MAKFTVGQSVEIAFNPQTPDPRVPQQSQPWRDQKGRLQPACPGTANYPTKPENGEILEVRETEGGGTFYLVTVLLRQEGERFGRKIVTESVRQRVIPEEKLRAVS